MPFQPLINFTLLIGMATSIADNIAAAWHHGGFTLINWHRQATDRALSEMADIRLIE